MQREYSGKRVSADINVAIVVSRFNELVTRKLLDGALDALKRHTTGDGGSVDIFWVPGSFELPMAAKRIVDSKMYEAVIALGCLVRGETDHYDLLAHEVTKGLAQIALKTVIPLTYGVITADTVEQALSRAGIKHGNKGFDAAVSAIEMISLYRQIAEVEIQV